MLNIEIIGFANEKKMLEKYLYVPESNFLLELYNLSFKHIIFDYDMFLKFNSQQLKEVNYSAYKFGEIINSLYLVTNHFLMQTYFYIIENDKNLGLIIEDSEKKIDNIFGTYEIGKNKGKDSWGNKNDYLLKKISHILKIDLREEIKEIKYLEILVRNFFSHGWHLLFLNLFISDTRRVNPYQLQYNKNYENDDSIIFIKHDNFHKSEDMNLVRKELLNLPKPFTETNDLNFFLQTPNYNNFYYLNGNDFIINTACSRIFLKKNYFNKYSFLPAKDNRNQTQNMYFKLSEVICSQEKIINIHSVLKVISSLVEKIDFKLK